VLTTAKMTAKGQTTIPQNVRRALHVVPGDSMTWSVDAQAVATVQRAQSLDIDYLRAVEGTLGVWNSAADQEAYRDL